MSPETPGQVADVLGVLAIAGSLATVIVLAGLGLPSTRLRILTALGGSATVLATGIATIATTGSLWFSEGADFPPCELCWYQRIAMYPLVVVLGTAAWSRETSTRLVGFVLAGLGLAVNTWHNVIETNPHLAGDSCDPANPCTLRWVEGLGFWTIPRLATVGFALIIVLLTIDHLHTRGATP